MTMFLVTIADEHDTSPEDVHDALLSWVDPHAEVAVEQIEVVHKDRPDFGGQSGLTYRVLDVA